MLQKLIFQAPVSQLSLGQVSFNLLRELYKRKVQVAFFPIGNPDFSPFKIDPQFGAWLEQAANNRYARLDRKVPTLKVWHIRDSESRISDKQALLSFIETDSPTVEEVSIVNHQDCTFFTSSEAVNNFLTFGASNVFYTPLGIDEDFVPSENRLVDENITHWICIGKHEWRKLTDAKILAWMKKYGGNKDHQLTLCVNNPFYQKQTCGFNTEDLLNRLFAAVGGKPFNVNVLPHLKTNAEMLRVHQAADLDISAISRGEAACIPGMVSTALGKWAAVTNCTGHKDWATNENSLLIEPTGMVKASDNFFFRPGDKFNQGNMYDFSNEIIEESLVELEKLAKTPNPEGQKLKNTHTYSIMLDKMFEKLES